jgi:MFS family permease
MADPVSGVKQEKTSPLAVFAHGDFFLLWSSAAAITVSRQIQLLVSTQWLYETTGSAAQLGLLGVVQLIQMPMALYGGALADQIDRKKLMVLTQLVNTLSLMVLTTLALTHILTPWHIFAVSGISSLVNPLGGSARPAMLPRVVSRNLLTHAITTLNVTSQLATVFSPILFWQFYEHLGVAVSFAISTGVSLLSVIMPLIIKASGKPDATSRKNTWESLKGGWVFVMRHQLLPGIFFLDLGVTIVSFYRQLFPVFADQLYGLGATGTGLLNTANAIGGIVGTFAVFYAGKFAKKGVIVLAATMAYAVFLVAFGINRNFLLGLGIVGILGMTDAVTMTMRQAVVQLTTPDQFLGRASSILNFAAMSANSAGQVEVGMLSATIGAGNTMLLGGVLSILFTVIVWRFLPKIRQYRYTPE